MTTNASPPSETFIGAGETGTIIRTRDWSTTPVGPIDTWPQSLRTALSICLNSKQPMFVWWKTGERLTIFYNDAYIPIAGAKHPEQIGSDCWSAKGWAEMRPYLQPLVDQVFGEGAASWRDNMLLPLYRQESFLEEGYFSFSYSPIYGEAGDVAGMHCSTTETTKQVLGERRLKLLRDLGTGVAFAEVAEVAKHAGEQLASNLRDIPFALLYLVEPDGTRASLAAASLLARGTAASPETIELGANAARAPWPLAEVFESKAMTRVRGVRATLPADLPTESWSEPPDEAVVLPIEPPGRDRLIGFLVVGLSPRLHFDHDYESFLRLVVGHVGANLTSARTVEAERERAEKLAELDRAKTAFFSNVSHEFRTPLTLVLGPLEDSLADTRDPLSPGQRARAELARRNGLRLLKLVNTLLDFARIEAGRAHASFVPTDLATLTADLASNFRSAVDKAGMRLVVDCPALPEAVFVDPSMWEKIVLNLLSNAFKFTFEGEIRVTLRARGERVELAVRDTGTGIPAEELPHVFERFHRVRDARGRSHEGSGIGLALVRELVKLHGGEIDVESTPGRGSTFRLSIPVHQTQPSATGAAAGKRALAPSSVGPEAFLAEIAQWSSEHEPPSAGAVSPIEASTSENPAEVAAPNARILVADDNTDMRAYIARLLSPHWHVTTVTNGVEALAAARVDPPDLILSDVMMPGLDGLALLRALRADDRTRTIPVVLLSARAGEEATVEGLASGADAYLVKPFSANELRARVSAQLALSALRQEAVRKERAHAEETRRLLEEARTATRARDDMVAVVTHDLRAPLAAIRTAAELIQHARVQGDSDRVRSKASLIERSVDAMVRLIGDLLDISSIESGTLTVTPRPEHVGPILEQLRDTFGATAHEKGVALTFDVEPGLAAPAVDKDRVVQALSNLVGNAIKFTAGGGRVEVSVKREDGGILFAVRDTGIGISAEAMDHIFDRFWHSAQQGRTGHGLGLSIAKGIIEAHGGTLQVESERGRGSTFSFVLDAPGVRAVDAPRRDRPRLSAS